MSPQRYQPVNPLDDDDHDSPVDQSNYYIPNSPPPSFRSRDSSPTSKRLLVQDPLNNDADQNLADTFDDGEGSDAEDDADDRQRLMRAIPPATQPEEQSSPPSDPTRPTQRIERRVTELPAFRAPTTTAGSANDGVFANLAAKVDRGEQVDEKPPTYEQAAADATPPYWETTILAPGMSSDEVYVDGLPVGSLFSFIWNGMISMSFQLVGFLLTYLLHTTHAAKNGSRAGLGLTLVQYGFYMRSAPDRSEGNPGQFRDSGPPDPNSHNFDPNNVDGGSGDSGTGGGALGLSGGDWVSYILMIVGWFILIRAVSDFLRARKQEALILSSPTRGLPVPVVAEGETPEQTA